MEWQINKVGETREWNRNERHVIKTDNERQRENKTFIDSRRGDEGNLLKMSEKDWKRRRRVSWDLADGDLKAVLLTPGECYSCPGWKISSCLPDQTAARPVGEKIESANCTVPHCTNTYTYICDAKPLRTLLTDTNTSYLPAWYWPYSNFNCTPQRVFWDLTCLAQLK